MREEFKRLKKWVEMCPVEAAMRIEELEAKNDSLKKQLDAKITLINNGWEEERYALQERVITLEEKVLNKTIETDKAGDEFLIKIQKEIEESQQRMKEKQERFEEKRKNREKHFDFISRKG